MLTTLPPRGRCSGGPDLIESAEDGITFVSWASGALLGARRGRISGCSALTVRGINIDVSAVCPQRLELGVVAGGEPGVQGDWMASPAGSAERTVPPLLTPRA